MNEEIKIEKGIAIPKRTSQFGITATMRKMEIGDSFLVSERSRAGIFATSSRLGIKIATRKDGDDHIRVWRIA